VKITPEQVQVFIDTVDSNNNQTVEQSEFPDLIFHVCFFLPAEDPVPYTQYFTCVNFHSLPVRLQMATADLNSHHRAPPLGSC
jgi:hypothetical protein